MPGRTGRLLLFVFVYLFCIEATNAQLNANAGPDKELCPGSIATIGGAPSATGGLAPYTYSWSPSTGLSNTTVPNPTANPPYNTTYTLTVTDDTGAVDTDVIEVYYNYIVNVNAGNDTSICEFSFATLGGAQNLSTGITYSWSPALFLDNTNTAHPVSTPVGSMTYTMTATIAGCPPKIDAVTVTVIPTPQIDAGLDTTIQEGETVTLHVTGGFFYLWTPNNTLTYFYTADPDAEPIVTTTYYVYGSDETNKCVAFDSVTVTVEPSDDVVFYNTFTPNNDFNNDTWYIGNIHKYPDNDLQVFNRYGKLVFKANGYNNTWDGKAFGQELPSGTYFYKMDLGPGQKKYNGTVTIVK
jgi:gliding motility-associated-like protein